MEELPAPTVTAVKPLPKRKPRLVVVEQVTHLGEDGKPTCAESRFSRPAESDEQPYGPRFVSVSGDWKELDCGWLPSGCGMLVLANRGETSLEWGVFVDRLRDPLLEGAVIAVGPIRPGESARFEPGNPASLRVRCPVGGGKYSITLMPA